MFGVLYVSIPLGHEGFFGSSDTQRCGSSQASLPAPRVPSDPLAPGAPAELEKGQKGEKGEKGKVGRH